jgi:putative holliday junction resolvase
MSRVLGIDIGLQRTGLAISDELRLTTRALPTMTPRARQQDIDTLIALVREQDIKDIVIGLPLMPRSDDDGPMAVRVRGFAAALQSSLASSSLKVDVHLVDERGSSKTAEQRLIAAGVAKQQRKAALDGEVARWLIEEFVQRPAG